MKSTFVEPPGYRGRSMASFLAKQIAMPLFGVVDDQAKLRGKFSGSATGVGPFDVQDGDVGHVAEHVGIDATDDVNALKRFVSGGWHPAADPPGPTVLGNFGEMLTYLYLRRQGERPLRVVSYRRGGAPATADDFPMPDFLLEADEALGCLEVKTSSPLNYLDARDVVGSANRHVWRQLAPCKTIPGHWSEALRQLGRTDAAATAPLHDLVLRDERVLRFPSDFGIAHVHLVRDGRMDALRNHPNAARLKTPPTCVKLGRTCWTCMEATSGTPPSPRLVDVVSIHMHNEPGRLVLLGSGSPEAQRTWREAYEGWSRALWARDPVVARPFDERLVEATEMWLEGTALASSEDALAVVRGGWDRYLGAEAISRGLREVGVRQRFPEDRMRSALDREKAADSSEPEVDIQDAVPPGLFAEPVVRRVRILRDGAAFTILADRETIEIRTLRESSAQPLLDEGARTTKVLVRVALETLHGIRAQEIVVRGGPGAVTIRYDGQSFALGWRFRARVEPWGVVAIVADESGPSRYVVTPWMVALNLGDPRTALGGYDDGRAYLRLPRDLATPLVWTTTI